MNGRSAARRQLVSRQQDVEKRVGGEDGFDAMASNPEFAGIAGQMSEQMAASAGMQIATHVARVGRVGSVLLTKKDKKKK